MRKLEALCLLTGAILMLAASPVLAQPQTSGGPLPGTIRVSLYGCDLLQSASPAIREHLERELQSLEVELLHDDAPRRADAKLEIYGLACDEATARVRFVLNATRHGRLHEHESEFALGAPEAARTLALAATELVRTRWASLVTPRQRAATAARLERLEGAVEALRERRQSAARVHRRDMDALKRDLVRQRAQMAQRETASQSPPPPAALVVVAATASIYASGPVGLGGVRAALDSPVGPIRLVVDLDAQFGEVWTELGDVQFQAIRASGALLSPATEGPVSFAAGLFGQLGYSAAEGQPRSSREDVLGRRIDTGLAAFGGRVAFYSRLGAPWWLGVTLDVGYVPWGADARATGRRVGALDGVMMGLSIGLGFELMTADQEP